MSNTASVPGGKYDPTLLLEKQELSLAIDDAQVELAGLRAAHLEPRVAALDDELVRTAADLETAAAAYAKAETAYRRAASERAEAQHTHALTTERRAALGAMHRQALVDETRWRDERVRDEQIQQHARKFPLPTSRVA